ncbi:MAG: ribose-phosphate diphosphokinase [Chloroflexota bacterium]|jgi:ribose-phosphate pyrophosphokinase|nr:ribose-phosphate diphosphokinase [Chloroflexota bacterium]
MTKPHMQHDLLYGNIKLFAGTASPLLSQEIADFLGVPLCGRDIIEFPNENLFVRLHSSVRGQDCYVIQSTPAPVHRNLMELLILIQTLKLDSAGRITAVVPYLCYGRSDKKDKPRVPITARLVADMIQIAGADRYMTYDLHAGQIQGFFSIPGDVLRGFHILKDHLLGIAPQLYNPVVVTADLGFAKKGRVYADLLNTGLAFIEKKRTGDIRNPRSMNIIGDVKDRDVVLVDDEVNTGGSMVHAVEILKAHGAKEIYMFFVHPLLSNDAAERLAELPIKSFVTTNTIHIPQEKIDLFGDRLKVLSIGPMLGEVIERANEGRSVGEMFNE